MASFINMYVRHYQRFGDADCFSQALVIKRKMNWDNKHEGTFAVIQSEPLKSLLKKFMGNIKGISLEGESPEVRNTKGWLGLLCLLLSRWISTYCTYTAPRSGRLLKS